jgi:hypothetical protein
MARINLQETDVPRQLGGGMPAQAGSSTLVVPTRWSPRWLLSLAFSALTGVEAGRGSESGGLQPPSYRTVRRGIARELNRARRFERPLSVIVLRTRTLRTTGLEAAIRIALQRLRDTDLWFHDAEAGELILVAPETGHAAAQAVGRRLAASLGAGDRAAVEWATASFPGDGLTFEVLYQTCQERVSTPVRAWAADPVGLR